MSPQELVKLNEEGANTAADLSDTSDGPVDIGGAFRQALVKGELELEYQSQISLAIGTVTSFEALLRWRHPVHGDVKPPVVIALAESCGLTSDLNRWILRRACADALAWPANIRVAVNVSAASLVDPTFADVVAEVLQSSGLPAARLELEITEDALMPASKAVLAMLHRIRDVGVRFAIDDFDAGYSCLGYLLDFPFDKIKIDRSFISRLGRLEPRNEVANAIVASISRLCANLGIICLAEGVETAEQLALLVEAGCAEAQGFLMSRPMRRGNVDNFLHSGMLKVIASATSIGAPNIPFQQIAETANDIIIVTTTNLDPPGPTIVYVNPAFTKLTGYKASEVIGSSP